MNPLESYLQELRDIRSTGAAVKETSYYSALANLLNEVGKTLKPQVRCVLTLKNRGAGIPDGGLFTPDQFQKSTGGESIQGQNPARGVIEVKGTHDDAWVIAEGAQVSRYWGKYRQVLVTNYRDFVLIGEDASGNAAKLETYRLAESEKEFWTKAAHPRKMADEHAERFVEYLKRVMLNVATLTDPQEVAWFLASYARDARIRVEHSDLAALAPLRLALEEALGIKFEGEKGEHFFRATLVQTLFYGIFSGWVLWHKQRPARKDAFDWRVAEYYLHVPLLASLYSDLTKSTNLRKPNLPEVLDWATAALNRVNREMFFAKFEEHHAVQYFYEPFLNAYDPQLRKDLGVWYTPPEIVQYMVARVDTVLREELDIEDGLADSRVYVLDPACGTGAYLVQVLRCIHATLEAKGEGALAAHAVSRAARERVFGFEILPAPFVISHLQVGVLLQNLGAPLSEKKGERAGIYLTNSLTGREPPKGAKQHLMWPELEQERDLAEKVKRSNQILVIIGNPPYNAFAGVSPAEEHGLVEPYKAGLISEWGIKKFNLDDLYVRFFRLAERTIADQTGKGVVCYISNFSYLSDPSFVVMRKRFLSEFDSLWFDCMNGDSRETGKLTPEGKPDPSVFSTEYNREGIRVGTAIGLMVRREQRDSQPTVRFRHFWGMTKRTDLLASLRAKNVDNEYQVVGPVKSNRYSFRSSDVPTQYLSWPRLVELGGTQPVQGMDEDRGNALIDIDPNLVKARIEKYFGHSVSWDEFESLRTGLSRKSAAFDPRKVRAKACNMDRFTPSNVRRYLFRPYDVRWCYYTSVPNVWKRSRPELWKQMWTGNSFILSRAAGVAEPEGIPMLYTANLMARDSMRGHAVAFPLRVREQQAIDLEQVQANLIANLSPNARTYLASLGIENPDADQETAALVWMHALAIGYSPAYLKENADGIRQDWPRIPLPDSKENLLASAALGKQIAALLDTETPVKGVTTGAIRPDLRTIAIISCVGGGALKPDCGDLNVTVGWGHAGKEGVTMPGKGKLEERTERAIKTYDVYMNDKAYWKNIPAPVWEYTIGGYQVIKKWLSYREYDLLGRGLTDDEMREVTNMARRIAAILALEPELDANYKRVEESVYKWPTA